MALVIHPLNDLIATFMDIFFKALHQISQNVQSANACRYNQKVFFYGLAMIHSSKVVFFLPNRRTNHSPLV